MYGIILAAGRGARAWPLTDEIPKSMIPIAGRPFLEHQIDWLKTGGITDVIVDEGYRAREIDEYLQDGSAFGVRIIHRIDPDLSKGAVGHIKSCLQQIPDEEGDVVIMAGDVLTDADLPTFVGTHRARALPITLFGKEFQPSAGIVTADRGGRILEFRERPTLHDHYVNTSIGIVQKKIEGYLPPQGHNFWGEVLRVLRGSIYTQPDAAWYHLTDISDAYRIDGELSRLRDAQGLEEIARRHEDLAAYTRRQAAQLRESKPRGSGKERG